MGIFICREHGFFFLHLAVSRSELAICEPCGGGSLQGQGLMAQTPHGHRRGIAKLVCPSHLLGGKA